MIPNVIKNDIQEFKNPKLIAKSIASIESADDKLLPELNVFLLNACNNETINIRAKA